MFVKNTDYYKFYHIFNFYVNIGIQVFLKYTLYPKIFFQNQYFTLKSLNLSLNFIVKWKINKIS